MSLISIRAFVPKGSTVNLAVTASTGNVAITRPSIGTQTLRIVNIGTQTIFINFGIDNTVTATLAAGLPVLPNTVETFNIQNEITYVASIASAAGSTMYVTTGESA